MGAAATTAKQPLAEVDVKNEIGVLYGEEAQQAFAAAKEDDVVAWPKVQVYAEAHGLLDPKAVLFKNLRQFKIARAIRSRPSMTRTLRARSAKSGGAEKSSTTTGAN